MVNTQAVGTQSSKNPHPSISRHKSLGKQTNFQFYPVTAQVSRARIALGFLFCFILFLVVLPEEVSSDRSRQPGTDATQVTLYYVTETVIEQMTAQVSGALKFKI